MSQLKLICTPYSFEGKLFEAYDGIFERMDEADWVCFMDGDVAFLEMSDFGHVIQEYIDKYPDTGLFTCYASRCHYARQQRKNVDRASDSIDYYAVMTIKTKQELHLQVKNIETKIAGHLIVMQKQTWTKLRKTIKARSMKKNILGFDSQLSYSVLDAGLDIKLMRGVLVFHYLRKLTGQNKKIK